MDLDDLKLAGIGLLFAATGSVALVLAVQGLAADETTGVVMVVPAVVLLAAGRALDVTRPWSLRFGRVACVAAGGTWAIVGAAVLPGPEVMAYSAAMIGASGLGWAFLDDLVRGPDWLRPRAERPAATDNLPRSWIEDLPEGSLASPRP